MAPAGVFLRGILPQVYARRAMHGPGGLIFTRPSAAGSLPSGLAIRCLPGCDLQDTRSGAVCSASPAPAQLVVAFHLRRQCARWLRSAADGR